MIYGVRRPFVRAGRPLHVPSPGEQRPIEPLPQRCSQPAPERPLSQHLILTDWASGGKSPRCRPCRRRLRGRFVGRDRPLSGLAPAESAASG